VPAAMIESLERAGEDAAAVGLELTIELVGAIRSIAGVAGIHVMAMGHDDVTRELVERTGLFPRPVDGWDQPR